MAEENADWSSNSNDAVYISLVAPGEGGTKAIHTFNPKFTYPIFGDEERIFGYQGLKINLRYNSCDMRPSLQISYTKKFKTVGETSPTDLKAILEPFLPKTAFEKSAVFDTAISDASYATWKPPGELWKTIQSGDQTYEIWKGSLADLAVQQMVKRIQIMVPFFIEGGTFIDLEDPALDRWTLFFLYQKKTVEASKSPYLFMGYSTVYRYFYYQPLTTTPSKQRISHPATLDFTLPLPAPSEPTFSSRSRISQFVILPPFQGGGNGSRFYNAIFDYYLRDPLTIEITVEDPNEQFDDLRDLNDLTLLRTLPDFHALHINTASTPRARTPIPRDIVSSTALETLRKKMKIAPRQFYRVVEMQLLSKIPTTVRQSLLLEQERKVERDVGLAEKKKEYRLWQLWVKKRLYKHNKDMLIQLDRVERIEKLEQALGGVEADYARLLRAADDRGKPRVVGNGEGASEKNGKRSSPGEETDGGEGHAAKKVKFAE
ncbi:histone acetyltransferase type B [Hyaloscypha variabilis F]|uniref:Histone acetyltransferase type B catalytic subunit n=1 Tax=Hyaloscypha variabilis (strain UAMH 11265 / GT02V1 / F) TaxID=1149755 RepID=A0A2J6RR94_HYAVF|nr:histone acetyltransferase type B [Hyaloscypha variabilis F]